MDHSWLQAQLFDYYDGQLPAPQRAEVAAHLVSCASCRAELEAWRRTAGAFLHPLRSAPSPAFVRGVMREVQALPTFEAPRPLWPAHWAFPALTLSMAGFAATFLYVVQPASGTADALLLEDQDQETPVALLSAVPSEDQILRSIVEKP